MDDYITARNDQVNNNNRDSILAKSINDWTRELIRVNYTKNFTWCGRPVIQYPSDMVVMQELIWEIKPDYIIETGIAFGGMTVFYATILEMLGHGTVIAIDKDIRIKNLQAIRSHPASKRIMLIQGSSTSREVLNKVEAFASGQIMVTLDSNHTHKHVLEELKLYSNFVSVGSYMVVFDTAIEFFMEKKPRDRPWGPGNNPFTAVKKFLKYNDSFEPDLNVEMRSMVTAAPGGWLRRIK